MLHKFGLKTFAAALTISALSVGAVQAGGFAIREQSTTFQGMAFAGSATGGSLSSMFWNSAAAVTREGGLQTESHIAIIFPQSELTALAGSTFTTPASTDIGLNAYVPSSYGSYQINERLFLGLATNGAFGLATKPDNRAWAGATLARTSSLFTTNVNPILSYKVTPRLSIGIGAQIQYGIGKFKFATGAPAGNTTYFEGTGFGFGATAGILWTPSDSTSVGLGWRSAVTQHLDGRFATNGLAPAVGAETDIELPDIVTLSIKQAFSPTVRGYATVEWSNWSRFTDLTVTADAVGATVLGAATPGSTIASIPAGWDDGWFFSLGGEYDVSPALTLRGGLAYEISPVREPTQRLSSVPDNDRIWASLGLTYKMSEKYTIDFAYTHIFIEEGRLDRENVTATNTLIADVDASVDIVSFALRTKWGAREPLK